MDRVELDEVTGCVDFGKQLDTLFLVSGRTLTRLFKIAWDLAGDALGTRQLQYERYYVGDPVRILARTFGSYDRCECQELVDYALALAGDPE